MNSKSILNTLDNGASSLCVALRGEENGLSTFLFHGVCRNEISAHSMYPQEGLTVELFDEFIDSFLNLGYRFVGPEDIVGGNTENEGKYGLLTFDDGYFNNTWIREVLHIYGAPAVFFITTALVIDNEKIWSDVIHCERMKRNATDAQIRREIKELNLVPVPEIRDYITAEFGTDAFRPQGDEDRPLSPAELREFAADPYVIIGNHTHSHGVLGNLPTERVKTELEHSQLILADILGKTPDFISYPYGSYSRRVVDIAKGLGFRFGITTIQRKNRLPLGEEAYMELRRFNPVSTGGKFPMNRLRSSFQLKTMLKETLQ